MRYRPEYDPIIIGENLRRLRKAKALSVEDVKEYLRLGSVQAVYKYENGKGYPPVDTMFALMELYEARLSDITQKHYDSVYGYSKEGSLPASVEFDLFITDKKIAWGRKNNAFVFEQERLKKYCELYLQYKRNTLSAPG